AVARQLGNRQHVGDGGKRDLVLGDHPRDRGSICEAPIVTHNRRDAKEGGTMLFLVGLIGALLGGAVWGFGGAVAGALVGPALLASMEAVQIPPAEPEPAASTAAAPEASPTPSPAATEPAAADIAWAAPSPRPPRPPPPPAVPLRDRLPPFISRFVFGGNTIV